MSAKIITSMRTLMLYANALGDARLSKDHEKIRVAKNNHDIYHKMCLESDEMICEGLSEVLNYNSDNR